jgi:hypothetical protein
VIGLNLIFEVSSKSVGNGRRPIKLILHEIYRDPSIWNANGISWAEEYALDTIGSIKGMSICAEFMDADKSEPFGHGLTEVRDDSLPLFEDATVVGHCTNGYVDTMTIDGEDKRVCIAEGLLDEMRYPKFIQWLGEQLETDGVKGSVEIIGLPENDHKIVYDGGWKEEGRVPKEYLYSGYAILGAKRGSDAAAVVVELNSEKENKGDRFMDEKGIMAEFQSIKEQISKLNTLEQKIAEINRLNAAIDRKNMEIKKQETALQKAEDERKALDSKCRKAGDQIRILEDLIAAKEVSEKIAGMKEAIAPFTDEQKAYAQAEIDAFTADPASIEINTIVGKICTEIVKKAKGAASASHEENTAEDIFAPVNPVGESGATGEDGDLF